MVVGNFDAQPPVRLIDRRFMHDTLTPVTASSTFGRARTLEPSTEAADGPALELAPLHGFRPDIQALRGLAVLAVVLYHAGKVLPGGYVGVDVFFVISGFVIGRRMLNEVTSTRDLSLRSFYVHRTRRILPALALMLTAVVLVSPLLAPIGARSVTTPTGIAASLFSANAYLYDVGGGGYFAPSTELNPLLHTWSLSVEEQFYFVVPLLVLVAWRLGRRRWSSLGTLRVLIIGATVASFVLGVWMSYHDGSVPSLDAPRFAFYSPVTRAWEFAAGLMLVLVPKRWLLRNYLRPLLVGVGLALIGVALAANSDTTVFPGIAAVIPVVGTALVIFGGTVTHSANPVTATSMVFTPMRWLGDVSYSWYLWHLPFIVFAAALLPASGTWLLLVAAALSLVPATASYRFVENRLRADRGRTPRTRPTVSLAAACIAIPLVAAVVAWPFGKVLNDYVRDSFGGILNAGNLHIDATSGCDNSVPLGRRAPDACAWGDESSATSIVLVGDSNAGHFSEMLIGAARAHDARVQIATRNSCPFADVTFEKDFLTARDAPSPVCRDFVMGTVEHLEANPPDVVVIATATDAYVDQDYIQLIDPATGERAAGAAAKAPIFEVGLARVIERLRAARTQVALINVVPRPGMWDPRECSNLAVLAHRCLPSAFHIDSRREPRAANTVEYRAATAAGASIWNFNREICPAGRCDLERDDQLVWGDTHHISVATSRALAPAASDKLAATLAAGR